MSIEQEIRDLTIAINTLAYAIMQRPVPMQTDIVELSEELQEVAGILPVAEPTPEPVAESVSEEVSDISRTELQSYCSKIIRKNGSTAKDTLIGWIHNHGAKNLLSLDDSYLAEFQAFANSVEESYDKTR